MPCAKHVQKAVEGEDSPPEFLDSAVEGFSVVQHGCDARVVKGVGNDGVLADAFCCRRLLELDECLRPS